MEPIKKLIFKKLSGEVVEDVEKYVKDWAKANPKGQIYVGADSQIHGRRLKFSTIIAMHYIDYMQVGHGCHILCADIWEKRTSRFPTDGLMEKLWREAEYALQASIMVSGTDEFFKKKIIVHLDFNPQETRKSNPVYAAGIGLLNGAGFTAYGKPFSIISSNSADWYVR